MIRPQALRREANSLRRTAKDGGNPVPAANRLSPLRTRSRRYSVKVRKPFRAFPRGCGIESQPKRKKNHRTRYLSRTLKVDGRPNTLEHQGTASAVKTPRAPARENTLILSANRRKNFTLPSRVLPGRTRPAGDGGPSFAPLSNQNSSTSISVSCSAGGETPLFTIVRGHFAL